MSIDSGTTNATSSDGGITIDLIGGQTFLAGVVAGKYFRVTSGPQAGKQAKITSKPLATRVICDPGIGSSITLESWVVLSNFPTTKDAVISRTAALTKFVGGVGRVRFNASRPLSLFQASIDLMVIAVDVIPPTTLRIHFNLPVFDNAALRNPDNYLVTPFTPASDPRPQLGVYSATPQVTQFPTYVDIVVDEETTGQSYQVEVLAVEKVG
jgi:hypothetical protein